MTSRDSDLRSAPARQTEGNMISKTNPSQAPRPNHLQPTADASPPRQTQVRIDPPLDPTRLGVQFSRAPEGHQRVTMGPDALEAIFGTGEPFQAAALLGHCVKGLSIAELGGGPAGEAEDERHFILSVVKDIAPRDAVERMLAVQMAATHVAMVRAAGSLARAGLLPQLEAHSTNFNKLGRTYAAQMEALRKHRNGGQQRVQVEHVHVHPGGQAIVGEVHHGGQGTRGEGGGDEK